MSKDNSSKRKEYLAKRKAAGYKQVNVEIQDDEELVQLLKAYAKGIREGSITTEATSEDEAVGQILAAVRRSERAAGAIEHAAEQAVSQAQLSSKALERIEATLKGFQVAQPQSPFADGKWPEVVSFDGGELYDRADKSVEALTPGLKEALRVGVACLREKEKVAKKRKIIAKLFLRLGMPAMGAIAIRNFN